MAMASLLAMTAAARAQIPMTGTEIPALAVVDQLMTNFMARYAVPGGSIGFVRDSRLVFVRGYGYANRETQEVVQPDSIFRLASVSKAVTAAGILRLVEQGRLSLDQPAFAILNYPPPSYPGATSDSRLASITVRHLLNHTGGWNRNTAINPGGGVGFDPTVNWPVRAATDMGSSRPADAATVVRWMMGKPLQFNPGTQYQYSNFGYTVLGRIIETNTGTNYEAFIRSVVAEAGVSRMRLGGSRFSERLPSEVTYYDYPGASLTTSIFPQETNLVSHPYNYSFPTMDSHGGLAASVIDVLRFASAVDGRPSYPDILSPASIAAMTARPVPPWGATQEPYYGMGWLVRNTPGNWWHDGALPGTRTEMVRAGNGFTWAILFNTRAANDTAFFNEMDALGWNTLAAVTNWPAHDLFDAAFSLEAWRFRKFTSAELADSTISGDGADPDHDQLPNLVEYALALNPRVFDAAMRPRGAIQTINGQSFLTMTFRHRFLAHEVAYVVEVSNDLMQWTTTTQQVGTVLGSDGIQTVTFRDLQPTPGAATRFMRLRVTRLPD
jgi:CubicO group peptidase (beta-lactamase class C family)